MQMCSSFDVQMSARGWSAARSHLRTSLNPLIIPDLSDICRMLRPTIQKTLSHAWSAFAMLTTMHETPPETHSGILQRAIVMTLLYSSAPYKQKMEIRGCARDDCSEIIIRTRGCLQGWRQREPVASVRLNNGHRGKLRRHLVILSWEIHVTALNDPAWDCNFRW